MNDGVVSAEHGEIVALQYFVRRLYVARLLAMPDPIAETAKMMDGAKHEEAMFMEASVKTDSTETTLAAIQCGWAISNMASDIEADVRAALGH
jgi:hypothetical protein